jgi:flagellar M-ring protein FliF
VVATVGEPRNPTGAGDPNDQRQEFSMAAAANSTESALVALGELFSPQRLGLLLGIAVVVALTVGGWLWSRTPEYRVLYANLSDRDGGAIVNALQQMNVPYKFADGSGAVMVPDNRVHEARLQLASQGLPRGGQVGFELMENPKLGASQFLEQVNYQRALEGELARTIQSLAAVQSARVHLALAKPTVFVREQQKPSASVLLNLNRGRGIDPAQVNAIIHLVSSSVPDMPVKNVTVVDQNGALLSATGGNAPNTAGLDASQLKFLREIEAGYVQRIESIIAPLVGAANVRAQVTADVDFSQTERAEETYKPNQNQTDAAIRSQQTSEETSANSAKAGGVPGALSNQPPVPPTAPIAAGQPGAAGQAAQTSASAANQNAVNNARKDATINYEVDKTIKHVRQPIGGLRRLSVAVVVNHRKEPGTEGKATTKPLTKEEMQQITDLVKEAVGYSEQRGDTLNIANSAFNEPEVEPPAEVPVWKDPEYIEPLKNIGKNGLIAALVLYLVLGVLRPTLKNLAERAALPSPRALQQAPEGVPQVAPPQGYEANLEMARQLAKQEPKLVASVVKNWVSSNE